MSKCSHLAHFLFLLAVCVEGRNIFGSPRVVPTLVQPDTLRSTVERGLLEFSLGLEKNSNLLHTEENNVIAPLSIGALAALLLAGAEGLTKKELEALFGIQNFPHKEEEIHRTMATLFYELERSNHVENKFSYGSGLFVQIGEQISHDYLRIAKDLYRSELIPVDFKKASYDTSALINKWVSNRTEGKINNLLEDVVEPSTVMIIANVFYFKGTWDQPFVEKYTKMQKFYVNKRETIAVPLMVSLLSAQYSKSRGSHAVLGLPYKGGETTMYFVLPEGDLRQFINTLTPDSILQIINQTVTQQTIVAIPRMRIEGSLELSGPLSSLGVKTLFKPSANLSGIGKGVYVSEMLHKVSIEVTETGTEGAAASAVTILRDGATPVFRADRPFLFFIYHQRSGTILFWGTVYRPQPLENTPSK